MKISKEILRRVDRELARRDFFHYCHVMDSKFFKYDREYQLLMARDMQDFITNDNDVLVVNVPPRFGKSYTATRLAEWLLGTDPTNKIMTGSYNEKLSTNFAKQVRNTIMEQKADAERTVYNDIFNDIKIKRGDGSMNLWALEGQYNNYLATSPTGTATGFGAKCLLPGTRIAVPGGHTPIEKLRVGDEVITYNINKSYQVTERVRAKQAKTDSEFTTITANQKKYKTTSEHLYYVIGNGYIKARSLCVGDKLIFIDGTAVEVEETFTETEQEQVVYDIQTGENHNFFANGILVHNCIIIDDLIKNAEESYNESILEGHWDWFRNTMLSRLESGGKIIIIMTRWATEDLAGKVLTELPKMGYKLQHIRLQAEKEDGTMLCDDILSRRDYELRKQTLNPEVASANYQQEPLDVQGRLYNKGFKTYAELPKDIAIIESYTDTADTGKDYLATVFYAVDLNGTVYVLDIIYTQDDMTITEPLVAKKIYENKVNIAIFEGNNGGTGFKRSVERIVRNKYKSNYTAFDSFHQSKSKQARILTNATWIMDNILFPVGWEYKYEDAYKALAKYNRKGKNEFDDLPDALTGVAERVSNGLSGNTNRTDKDTINELKNLGL